MPFWSVTVSAASADMPLWWEKVAVTVTRGRAGTDAGAVYVAGSPLAVVPGEIVPQAGEQGTPFCMMLQVTPLFVASLATVAVNCCVAFTLTLADVGVKETEMGAKVMPAR